MHSRSNFSSYPLTSFLFSWLHLKNRRSSRSLRRFTKIWRIVGCPCTGSTPPGASETKHDSGGPGGLPSRPANTRYC